MLQVTQIVIVVLVHTVDCTNHQELGRYCGTSCSVCLLHRESKIKVASKRRKADMRKKVVSRHIQIVSRHVKIVSNKKQQTTCTAHASSPTTIFEVLPCTQVIISNNHYTYS